MITIELTWFPKDWVEDMENAMDNVAGALILEDHPKGENHVNLLIGVNDYSDLYLIGLYAGLEKGNQCFEEAKPEMAKNLKKYIDKITNPSKN